MSVAGQPAVTPEKIQQLAWGYAPPLILESAIRNGIFEAINAGSKTVDEIVAQTGASKRGVRAIVNALAGFQLLSRGPDGGYAPSPDAAAFLVSGRPGYLGGLIKHTSEQLIPEWQKIADVVRTGKPQRVVNQEKAGAEFFHRFVEDIFPMSYPAALHLAGELGLAAAQQPVDVLDLAAGSGVWGIALAERSPMVHVTAVDWPGVLDVTRKLAGQHGVADRFTFVGGDLQSANFGHGHQIATLGHILHSEGEARSRQLLKKTFEALAPGGTIAVQEFLVEDDRSGPPTSLIFAVNMLVMTEAGDTFSLHEISGWLQEAGFQNIRTIQSPGPSPMILATKP